MKRTAWLALALVVAGLQAGCVTRRVMITSDPPGAVVYRDGQPIGATPLEEPFIYYGRYRYRFVLDGYEPLDVQPELVAPWYELPGIDFVSENLIPFTFRDIQKVHVKLARQQPIRQDDLRMAAEALRGQGKMIQRPANAPPLQPRQPPLATPPPPLINNNTPIVPPVPTISAPSGASVGFTAFPTPGVPSRQGP